MHCVIILLQNSDYCFCHCSRLFVRHSDTMLKCACSAVGTLRCVSPAGACKLPTHCAQRQRPILRLLLQLLVEKGADVNRPFTPESLPAVPFKHLVTQCPTPLHLACDRGDAELVKVGLILQHSSTKLHRCSDLLRKHFMHASLLHLQEVGMHVCTKLQHVSAVNHGVLNLLEVDSRGLSMQLQSYSQ